MYKVLNFWFSFKYSINTIYKVYPVLQFFHRVEQLRPKGNIEILPQAFHNLQRNYEILFPWNHYCGAYFAGRNDSMEMYPVNLPHILDEIWGNPFEIKNITLLGKKIKTSTRLLIV